MKAEDLRNLQAPLKDKYRSEASAALVTLKAEGKIGENLSCKVSTGKVIAEAGLHPATGGDGSLLCSGDMLLEALVACAGVTLNAVATALEINIENGIVKAEGDIDFRGTLGVSKECLVGFQQIRLIFDIDTNAPAEKLEKLISLTERYCVVYQTIKTGVGISTTLLNSSNPS